MRKLQCDLCGGPLTVQAGGQRAACENCGLVYFAERLRELLADGKETAPPQAEAAAWGLELRAVCRRVQGAPAFESFFLQVPQGGCVVLVGDKARGDLLVRLIAGLEPLDGGEICVQGAGVQALPPKERTIGTFLGGELYPKFNVYENLASPLQLLGETQAEIDRRVRLVAEQIGIADCLWKHKKDLTSEQQLVCHIARGAVRAGRGGVLLAELFPCPPPDIAGRLCDVLNRLRAEWALTVLLVTDRAEGLGALGADVVQLPQAEPVFEALWEPLPDTP